MRKQLLYELTQEEGSAGVYELPKSSENPIKLKERNHDKPLKILGFLNEIASCDSSVKKLSSGMEGIASILDQLLVFAVRSSLPEKFGLQKQDRAVFL
jgi:hypothetical protein